MTCAGHRFVQTSRRLRCAMFSVGARRVLLRMWTKSGLGDRGTDNLPGVSIFNMKHFLPSDAVSSCFLSQENAHIVAASDPSDVVAKAVAPPANVSARFDLIF